jgi:hypothetical protein
LGKWQHVPTRERHSREGGDPGKSKASMQIFNVYSLSKAQDFSPIKNILLWANILFHIKKFLGSRLRGNDARGGKHKAHHP